MLIDTDTPRFDRAGDAATTPAARPGPEPREPAQRENDGITVRLFWRAADDAVLLRVDDAKLGLRFELPVPGAEARQAFDHPFAYIEDTRRCGLATTRQPRCGRSAPFGRPARVPRG
jgi:hypothetical protein